MSKAPCFLSYFLLTLRKKKYFGEFEKKNLKPTNFLSTNPLDKTLQ